MDKLEFKEKYEEMKELLEKGRIDDAIDIVDGINWRKVHNVNALMKAAEVCEAAGRNDDAKELLYIAHDRSPIGRMILYQLALLCIKMGDLEEAQEHYADFVEIAPHDSLKYILKYQISKARGATDDTLIAILEEFKEHDFIEEWAYELAYLYHKTMRVDKCIALCDEIILWFGDGPYVERALEMKMLYQPLDKTQEEKYRSFQNRRDGLTEVKANELLESGEIVSKNMVIPQVQPPAERFNTINLQAEIKKNIDEIMRATEEEVVAQNMENIKSLVGDIPYLQPPEDEEKIIEQQQQAQERIDAKIRDKFQDYLSEEYDGQMSLYVPEPSEEDEQIEGQMTIDEMLDEWEKTRRAAEATLQDAKQEKLASAKNIALMEAGQIMDRLEEVKPKLDAGATPTELLKEEYLSRSVEARQERPVQESGFEQTTPSQEEMSAKETAESAAELAEDVKEAPSENSLGADVFTIPKVEPMGTVSGVGLEIPVVHLQDMTAHATEGSPITKAADKFATKQWKPQELDEARRDAEPQEPDQAGDVAESQEEEQSSENEEVSDVDYKEASKLVEDMNNMLQKEIDRILLAEEQKKEEEQQEEALQQEENATGEALAPDADFAVDLFAEGQEEAEGSDEEEVAADEEPESEELAEDATAEPEESTQESAPMEVASTEPEEIAQESAPMEATSTESEEAAQERATDELPEIALIDPEELMKEAASTESEGEKLPEIAPVHLDDDEVADLVDEHVLQKAIEGETFVRELSEEEKEIFSYFMPVAGMERIICQALSGVRYRLESKEKKLTGNVIIEGYAGSGKTMLASNLIKVLQMETGKLMGPTGKIDAKQLNNKDISAVLSKVDGGCLIIEKAGGLSEASMTVLVEQMTKGSLDVLMILEDERGRIEERLGQNVLFANMFTEKISIPVFTIDELVNFGKVYALEEGYTVDEMGVLAMYNRINLISHANQPTSLVEVRDIMEEAIDHAERGGIKGLLGRLGSKRYDEEGNLILHEQDFNR